jgi:hypothetical protein
MVKLLQQLVHMRRHTLLRRLHIFRFHTPSIAHHIHNVHLHHISASCSPPALRRYTTMRLYAPRRKRDTGIL